MALAEKGLPARLEACAPWSHPDTLTALDPAGTTPILLDEPPTGGDIAIAPILSIFEYLEEVYAAPRLFPTTSAARAEMRRLCAWITGKFDREVVDYTVRERIEKRLKRSGAPDFERIDRGHTALAWHLDYFDWLLEQRPWFAGETFTAADIAAAGALSAIDYTGAMPWDKAPNVREWYARIKSRPSMRPLLKDRIEGIPPPSYFDDPDF